jgi:site-specific DNA-methyltransferase (adenine-specific)
MAPGYDDSGAASRYFYCAKASKRDRDEGLEALAETRKNIHPTVKPCTLMGYLVRLVTPKGGTVLDPFNGSGSTGKATMYENKDRNANYKYIGIELTDDYLPIARARIEYAMNDSVFEDLSYNNIKETPKPKTDVETVKLW